MEIDDLTGYLVEHKDKDSVSGYPHDGVYIVAGRVRCKDRSTGEWYDAVEYQEGDCGMVFVREEKDFKDKFQKVKDECKI